MNLILTTLAEMNITDPAKVRKIAGLMLQSVHDTHVHRQAENIIAMTEQELELATQQIIGGR